MQSEKMQKVEAQQNCFFSEVEGRRSEGKRKTHSVGRHRSPSQRARSCPPPLRRYERVVIRVRLPSLSGGGGGLAGQESEKGPFPKKRERGAAHARKKSRRARKTSAATRLSPLNSSRFPCETVPHISLFPSATIESPSKTTNRVASRFLVFLVEADDFGGRRPRRRPSQFRNGSFSPLKRATCITQTFRVFACEASPRRALWPYRNGKGRNSQLSGTAAKRKHDAAATARPVFLSLNPPVSLTTSSPNTFETATATAARQRHRCGHPKPRLPNGTTRSSFLSWSRGF